EHVFFHGRWFGGGTVSGSVQTRRSHARRPRRGSYPRQRVRGFDIRVVDQGQGFLGVAWRPPFLEPSLRGAPDRIGFHGIFRVSSTNTVLPVLDRRADLGQGAALILLGARGVNLLQPRLGLRRPEPRLGQITRRLFRYQPVVHLLLYIRRDTASHGFFGGLHIRHDTVEERLIIAAP